MNNDTIIEEMRVWTHSEIDKALDKARADERAKFAHELKERFNVEFPSNYPSTKPFFTLENVRMIVDEVAEEQE